MSNDFIYWTFSAASQSISAFVAFLVAGYTLVHSMMEAERERDDTLAEIHAELKSVYHRRLTHLAWLTGAAIILSLVVVYVNRSATAAPRCLIFLVSCIDLAAVVLGLAFVVSIVNPSKYKKAAIKVLEDGKPQPNLDTKRSAADFFDSFRHLERLIRDYLRDRKLYIPSRGSPRMSYSFRQMIEALWQNEKIAGPFFEELTEINKYRNLVFHGHIQEADASMIKRVEEATKQIEKLKGNDGEKGSE